MKTDVYESSEIFDKINKQYFPYYDMYKNLLEGTDTALFYSEKCEEPVGVIIARPGYDEDTIHVSCLEVAEPIRREGWGSKILSEFKNNLNGIYKRITLRCLKPELIPFYRRNGFRVINTDPKNIIMEAII